MSSFKDIDAKSIEIKNILDDINNDHSSKKPPKWLTNAIEWVRDHSGSSQQYFNGGPVCHGNGACGPCPGICFGAINLNSQGEAITTQQYDDGFRSYRFSIIEHQETGELKILVEFNLYVDDYVENDVLIVDRNVTLPSSFTADFGYTTITISSGAYPVFLDSQTGYYETVIDAVIQ